jgi:DNA-binding NtrC family response regulator
MPDHGIGLKWPAYSFAPPITLFGVRNLGIVLMNRSITVLCVDDEQYVLNALNRLLRHDFHLLFANSGQEALTILQRHSVHVIISDQRMPGLSGVDMLKEAARIKPDAMRILLTGYADLQATIDAVNSGEVFRYITKPWNNDALKATIEQAAQAALATVGASAIAHAETASNVTPMRAVGAPIKLVNPFLAPPDGVDVLVIDADDAFLEQVKRACGDRRHVFQARSVREALEILERDPTIGVLLTEVQIGRERLVDMLGPLKALRPSLTAIVASGFSDANMVIALINEGQIFRFISKPTVPERLAGAITHAARKSLAVQGSHAQVARHQVQLSDATRRIVNEIQPQMQAAGGRGWASKFMDLFRRAAS